MTDFLITVLSHKRSIKCDFIGDVSRLDKFFSLSKARADLAKLELLTVNFPGSLKVPISGSSKVKLAQDMEFN